MSMEKIILQFTDFQRLVEAKPFGQGHINDTFRVTVIENGEQKNYLLQRINHDVFHQPQAVMENIRLVAEHLSKQDFPFKNLAPIPTRSGQLLHVEGERNHWRIFPFFENTFTFQQVETAEQAFEAARAFGAFAKALDGMDASALQVTIPHFHDGVFRMRKFKEILAAAKPERRKAANAEIEEVLRSEDVFEKVAALKLPLRVVHHDTKINNLLFDSDGLKPVAVVDLDTVMPGIILSDFGDLVRTSVSPVDEDEADLTKVVFRKEVHKALSEGFLSEMGALLTPPEREHLPTGGTWLTLMQAVRFLGDYLAGDVYYPTKYPEHNLVRTRNQLKLFREINGVGQKSSTVRRK